MAPIRALIAAVALVAAGAARAQPVQTSDAPDSVAVTIYRAPDRDVDDRPDLDWLEGYALVTERRTIDLPAGRAVVRFEGVAAGILPESAIVTGLPQGVREKNLDADLLSPRSLYARSLGRPVTLRRRVGERIVEEPAIIRSGPQGAAILQTKDGFVVANCGAEESIVYPQVPAGLSAKPTLSIETEAPSGGRVTITLSYLAWGFDWQANYVATMRPDGKSADLIAWVTLASSDSTSFTDAEAMVVAGKLNRESDRSDAEPPQSGGPLEMRCFLVVPPPPPPPPPPPAPPPPVMAAPIAEGMVVVTASRMRMARQEELGDLKLYRIPDRTTVAAMAQKQVLMLDKKSVPVAVVYRASVYEESVDDPEILLRAMNKVDRGLGLPLPAGPVAVFEPRGDEPLLVGEGTIEDKAIGEEVEIAIGEATQVQTEMAIGADKRDRTLTVTNANPYPVRFEGDFKLEDGARLGGPKFARKNGRPIWAMEVPANGERVLRYRVNRRD